MAGSLPVHINFENWKRYKAWKNHLTEPSALFVEGAKKTASLEEAESLFSAKNAIKL
jgi:hypothetical protein